MSYHIPVLYNESLEGLAIQPDGVYVDCTFGGGGHSKGILEKLNPDGRLFAFDQDADAKQNLPADERVTFVPYNFRHLQRMLRLHKVSSVNGVLADLGVSSHQFDEGDRGFSIRFSGPMDMRMDRRQGATAADIVRSYSEVQLHKMFEQYGEVTNAITLAKQIVHNRKHLPFATIEQFKALIKEMLQQIPVVLKPGGRVAIITFHSLEDRVVKNFFRQGSFDETPDNPLMSVEKQEIFKLITKKPITATDDELKKNNRSRSAKLRVAEKI